MVVDDSPLVRKIVTDILSAQPDIGVCATAPSGELALHKLERSQPDVVTMDISMPGMGGLAAIRQIMGSRPTPVIVLSAFAHRGAEHTLQALEAGAVDFVLKPSVSISGGVAQVARELVDKIRQAAQINLGLLAPPPPAPGAADPRGEAAAPTPALLRPVEIVAIGASTGGPAALKVVLQSLPEDLPVGVVVVQHMPVLFTRPFAEHLDAICRVAVKEAEHGDEIVDGRVLVAPGDRHMTVTREGGRPRVLLNQDEPVGGHRPSVDVLVRSVAREYGCRAIGVIMTGMGKDGAQGIGELRDQGGYVIAQDSATSVVFGMNGEVVRRGAAHAVVPVSAIAGAILSRIHSPEAAG